MQESGPIEIVPYNPKWELEFKVEKSLLKNVFNDNLIKIYHIGSTSIPGMAAKPIIDIMPVVKSLEKVDSCNKAMEKLCYVPMGEYGIVGRRYFRKGAQKRTHNVHVFEY